MSKRTCPQCGKVWRAYKSDCDRSDCPMVSGNVAPPEPPEADDTDGQDVDTATDSE